MTEPEKVMHCTICDLYYDPQKGIPSLDIPPGTPWEDIPEDFLCLGCGFGKEEYAEKELNPASSTPLA